MKKKLLVIVIALVAVAAVVAGVWLGVGRAGERGDEASTDGRAAVAVRRGDLVEVASATGTVEPDVQVEVKSRASGEVVDVLVEEGDQVDAGQLLVKLDPIDTERDVRVAQIALDKAQADLAQARASLVVAQAERDEAKAKAAVRDRGAELGLVSAEDRRTAKSSAGVADATVTLRESQIRSAQSQVASARLDVDEALRRLSETEIRAPIPGTVLAVNVERGTIVSSGITTFSGGTAVLTLADLADLRVVGDLDEAQVGRVRDGQEVTITVDAFPDRSFSGRVERVSPLGETTSNVVTFPVEIVVTDRESSLLRSGMSADLAIVTGRHEGALLVPLTAIYGSARSRHVVLADGEPRPVRTGATDGTDIVVLEGLREGELVLASGRGSARSRNEPSGSKSFLPFGRPPGPPRGR
jgi:HlyD family secretion protein